MNKNLRKTIVIALMIALSAVGAFIKIPSPTGTVAFDSLPAFIGGLLFGGIPGGIIGFLGHLVSAATAGFPLSLPVHLIVGVQMFVIVLIFGWLAKQKWLSQKINLIIAIVVAILLNGIAAPATLIPIFGVAIFFPLMTSLLVGSAANIIFAVVIYLAIKDTKPVKDFTLGDK